MTYSQRQELSQLPVHMPPAINHHQVSPPQQQQQQQQQALQQPHQAVTSETGQVAPDDPLNNTSSNIFNDTISSFFAPYGVDVSHFPLTNPPIFESALYNVDSDTEPRRRRISISNGQIGQIINNHTLNNEELYDIQMPPYPKFQHHQQPLVQQQQQRPPPPQQQQQQQHQQQPSQQLDVGLTRPRMAPQSVAIPQRQQQQVPILLPAEIVPGSDRQSVAQQAVGGVLPQQQQQQRQQQATPSVPYSTNPQGVPNGKLIYNNEVIFNADAGPIPGTAAWKKARLLERNRIAASKCRQRKKAAQIQLKENVANYERVIDRLETKNEALIQLYEFVKSQGDDGDVKLQSILRSIAATLDSDDDDDDVKS